MKVKDHCGKAKTRVNDLHQGDVIAVNSGYAMVLNVYRGESPMIDYIMLSDGRGLGEVRINRALGGNVTTRVKAHLVIE